MSSPMLLLAQWGSIFFYNIGLSPQDIIQRESLDWYYSQLMAKIKQRHTNVKIDMASPLAIHSSPPQEKPLHRD